MDTRRTVMRAASVLCLVLASSYYAAVQAQPANAVTTEKEFFEAIKKGNSPRVSELLKQQPTLIKANYKNGITPVLLAVYAKHPEIAESLIATTGIELNIFEAATTSRIARVRELLKRDPILIRAWSADGGTALHLNFNNLEMAKLLIDAGADLDVNSRNKLNATPLQGAAANN